MDGPVELLEGAKTFSDFPESSRKRNVLGLQTAGKKSKSDEVRKAGEDLFNT